MTRQLLTAACAAAVFAISLAAVSPAPPSPAMCANLLAARLPDTTIKSADEVAGPQFTPPTGTALNNLPAFCRVVGVTKPAIRFEAWLPLGIWNGKFNGVGNGANAGSISYGAMASALRRGYATASTDTGHATTNARDASWALGHPELLEDFGHRAIHVTAENARQLVRSFYGQAPAKSYFESCSTGGRQALMEAQRYPEDYDGIVAGAPAANWTRLQTGGHLWAVLALNKDPESYIPAGKLKLLGDAVNAACDKLDGIADGVVDDPRRCGFDPQTLVCKPSQDPGACLTAKQAKAVADIWAGAKTSKREQIYPGYMPGAEAAGGWAAYMSGSGPRTGNHWDQSDNVLKYMVFGNPAWDFRTFDFDRDVAPAQARLGRILDAFDPDLDRFRRRGAKLIIYHGWNDPSISPLNSIDYYEKVQARLRGAGNRDEAERETQSFLRLFLAPGMLHCGQGPGPNSFDMLAALDAWVEKGVAPEQVIASHATGGVVDRTRPLCAYPKVAVYSGHGSTDDAANFACKARTH